jgi:hypothetical protein
MENITGLKNQKTMHPKLQQQAEAVRFRAYWGRIGQLQAEADWREEQRMNPQSVPPKKYLGGLEVG